MAMRRLLIAALTVPMLLVVVVGPVAADTTPAGNFTQFISSTSTCTATAGRQLCTVTQLSTFIDDTGTAQLCVDISTYSIAGRTPPMFVSDKYGCTSNFSQTVGSDYSVTVAPTTVSLATCKAHQVRCSGSTDVTVSATDSTVTGVSTTTSTTTTTSGGCTTTTTTDETQATLLGTMTIGSATDDEDGFLDIVSSTSTSTC